jgi:protein TonB
MTKRLGFIFFLVSWFCSVSGQAEKERLIGDNEPFSYVEVMPSFKGGQNAMYKFVYDHITYPPLARENNIQGMVVVQYVVDIDSLAKRIQILRGVGAGCNEEVLRVMHLMNEEKMWIPGRHNGAAVPVIFTLPVTFKLTGKEPKKPKKKM